MSSVADPQLAEALDALVSSLDAVASTGVVPVDARDAITVIREVESCARRLASVQIGLVAEVERRGLHEPDGHSSERTMIAHVARLSDKTSGRRARQAQALRDLPAVAAAFAAGRIGTCQIGRIATCHANSRVRRKLIANDAHLAVIAERYTYDQFDAHLSTWTQRSDQTGTRAAAERNHDRRDFRISKNYDGSRRFEGGCGSVQGQELADIFDRYYHAEASADWAEARARLGTSASVTDLIRTPGQRRADALDAIFRDAAAAEAARPGSSAITTSILIDHTTFERELARLAGRDPGHDPRTDTWFKDLADQCRAAANTNTNNDPGTGPNPTDDPDTDDPGTGLSQPIGFRCSSLDGTPLDPTEAALATLLGRARRVIIGADSVPLDMGRSTRLFTGPRQLAVRLQATHCIWPGCHRPSTWCQADHMIPWSGPGHGNTNIDNGAPLCGKHNRHKHHGYTVTRDPDGTFHTHRPDGTEIT